MHHIDSGLCLAFTGGKRGSSSNGLRFALKACKSGSRRQTFSWHTSAHIVSNVVKSPRVRVSDPPRHGKKLMKWAAVHAMQRKSVPSWAQKSSHPASQLRHDNHLKSMLPSSQERHLSSRPSWANAEAGGHREWKHGVVAHHTHHHTHHHHHHKSSSSSGPKPTRTERILAKYVKHGEFQWKTTSSSSPAARAKEAKAYRLFRRQQRAEERKEERKEIAKEKRC